MSNFNLYFFSSLSWAPDDKPEGISIMWKQISVHGISSNPVKCIYFMLDHQFVWRGVYDGAVAIAANGHGDGAAAGLPMENENGADSVEEDEGNETDNEDAEEQQLTECWLIPADVNTVDTIFQAMTECQALHPDSADSISEESDFMDDCDEDDENGIVGPVVAVNVEHGQGDNADAVARGGIENLNINDDRFADADE